MFSPEYRSVQAFGDYLLSDDRTEFTFAEADLLAQVLGFSIASPVIKQLKSLGFTMQPRAEVKQVRGFTANPNNHSASLRFTFEDESARWQACPSHGGSGTSQIFGFAGKEG